MASESDVPFGSEADEFNELLFPGTPETRRKVIKQVAETSAAITVGANLLSASSVNRTEPTSAPGVAGDLVNVHLKINGKAYTLYIDPRVTLLDALRER